MLWQSLAACLVVCSQSSFAYAERFHLSDGRIVDGVVVFETENEFIVDAVVSGIRAAGLRLQKSDVIRRDLSPIAANTETSTAILASPADESGTHESSEPSVVPEPRDRIIDDRRRLISDAMRTEFKEEWLRLIHQRRQSLRQERENLRVSGARLLDGPQTPASRRSLRDELRDSERRARDLDAELESDEASVASASNAALDAAILQDWDRQDKVDGLEHQFPHLRMIKDPQKAASFYLGLLEGSGGVRRAALGRVEAGPDTAIAHCEFEFITQAGFIRINSGGLGMRRRGPYWCATAVDIDGVNITPLDGFDIPNAAQGTWLTNADQPVVPRPYKLNLEAATRAPK